MRRSSLFMHDAINDGANELPDSRFLLFVGLNEDGEPHGEGDMFKRRSCK